MLAVGDISGKGISAALLMATVHAFVRAYSLEPERTLASVALDAGSPGTALCPCTIAGDGVSDSELAPGLLMATLNYQLYRSTPPEKYATMFLGCYDASSRARSPIPMPDTFLHWSLATMARSGAWRLPAQWLVCSTE